MLFPNRARAPEIAPGMGFHSGARAMSGGEARLAYTAHMAYHSGARMMGAVSEAEMLRAFAAGLDANTLEALSAAGANDADIEELMAGYTDVPTLMAEYAGQVPTETTTVIPRPPEPLQHPQTQAQIPTGSTLVYEATSSRGLLSKLFTSTASVVADFNSHLSGTGMSVLSWQPAGSGTIQIHIADDVGHAWISDAHSVLDDAMRAVISGELAGSHVTVVSQATGNATLPGSPATNLTAWFENNATYIGLGIAGMFVLHTFFGGNRR